MLKTDNLTRDVMPEQHWRDLDFALMTKRRGDPRQWYRLLRAYCGYTAGSRIDSVMELRLDEARHEK